MLYPKINSLYKREGCGPFDEEKGRYTCDLQGKRRKSPLIEGQYSRDEFPNINKWLVTEKIDGTNIRITFKRDIEEESVSIGGRTENAQLPCNLLSYLQKTFTLDLMKKQFPEANFVVLFGEGYGPKIQSGGYYREDVSFILFDAYVGGWWLDPYAIEHLAKELGIDSVPLLPVMIGYDRWDIEEIVNYVKDKPRSYIAKDDHMMEGIIATSFPLMLFRNGEPIKFKLKCEDFS